MSERKRIPFTRLTRPRDGLVRLMGVGGRDGRYRDLAMSRIIAQG
jgi:hypothetical protein